MIPKPLARLLRPTVWVTAERAFSELFFLALFAIQAPILGPAAFGLVAAVMVFVAFWEGVPGHAMTEALLSTARSTIGTSAASRRRRRCYAFCSGWHCSHLPSHLPRRSAMPSWRVSCG